MCPLRSRRMAFGSADGPLLELLPRIGDSLGVGCTTRQAHETWPRSPDDRRKPRVRSPLMRGHRGTCRSRGPSWSVGRAGERSRRQQQLPGEADGERGQGDVGRHRLGWLAQGHDHLAVVAQQVRVRGPDVRRQRHGALPDGRGIARHAPGSRGWLWGRQDRATIREGVSRPAWRFSASVEGRRGIRELLRLIRCVRVYLGLGTGVGRWELRSSRSPPGWGCHAPVRRFLSRIVLG